MRFAAFSARVARAPAFDNRAAIDHGINFFDIAPVYGFSHSETVLGSILKKHGLRNKVLIASNQSCIARGTDNGYDFAAEFSAYGADSWFLCPHDAHDGCDCRKPKPGLLLRAAEQYGLDLKRCVMVGDRWTDMKCGFDAGTRCIFLRNEAATPLPTDDPEKMYWIERADAQTDDLRLIPQIVLAWGG